MSVNKKDVGAILIFVALIVGFVLLINGITNKGSSREMDIVRDAVKNASLTCYAVEGMYPESLDYLKQHYNLSYNEDKYVVYYEPLASNLMPSIKVAERGEMGLWAKRSDIIPGPFRTCSFCCSCPFSPA